MSTIVLRRPVRRADLFAPFAPLAVPVRPSVASLPSVPPVALERDGEDGVLVVEAPGVDAERDLRVDVTGSRLMVAGTRRETSGRTRRETRFSRTVTLPEGVTADAVSARYEAGVLRVRVAGMFPAPVEPETVRVAITSDVPAAEDRAVEAPQSQPADQVEQPAECAEDQAAA